MKYNTISAFGENNESGIRSRQVQVWRGLISIVLSVINSGPNKYYGIDRIPVCTGSGMDRLHCNSKEKDQNSKNSPFITASTSTLYIDTNKKPAKNHFPLIMVFKLGQCPSALEHG